MVYPAILVSSIVPPEALNPEDVYKRDLYNPDSAEIIGAIFNQPNVDKEEPRTVQALLLLMI
jgi:hypothetical protein